MDRKSETESGKMMEKQGWNILSLRDAPEFLERFISFFAAAWSRKSFYRDCMEACLTSDNPLPQWYLLENGAGETLGCAGLVISDFTARGDLWPWLCALFIREEERAQGCGAFLISHLKREAARLGYRKIYLCTDHVGYYEKHGFTFLGTAREVSGESSRIYCAETLPDWEYLTLYAKNILSPRTLSPLVEAGGVAAALLTDRGNVYRGVCIDTACSLGMCAERAAAGAMISAGEQHVRKLVCLMRSGTPGLPCGVCREFFMQLDPANRAMEILVSFSDGVRTVKLGDLLPAWWGEG